jgi:hypothetical protein
VSVTGATVWTGNTSKTETGIDINTSSLPAGMYYCMVQSGINRAVSPIAIVK